MDRIFVNSHAYSLAAFVDKTSHHCRVRWHFIEDRMIRTVFYMHYFEHLTRVLLMKRPPLKGYCSYFITSSVHSSSDRHQPSTSFAVLTTRDRRTIPVRLNLFKCILHCHKKQADGSCVYVQNLLPCDLHIRIWVTWVRIFAQSRATCPYLVPGAEDVADKL